MKNLLNLGKALNKAEQKSVFGGFTPLTHNCGDQVGDECCHYELAHVTPCPTVVETSPIYEGGCWAKKKVCVPA